MTATRKQHSSKTARAAARRGPTVQATAPPKKAAQATAQPTVTAQGTAPPAPVGVLYVAFELGWNEWKLAFASGPGDNPRLRSVAGRSTAAVLQEIAKAKKRFDLPDDAPVRSCYEADRDGFWLARFLESKGIANQVVDSSSIGPNSAWLYVMEFFSWRRISNRRQLGSLAGLTPTPYDSGHSRREQGISKAGNRRLRTMAA